MPLAWCWHIECWALFWLLDSFVLSFWLLATFPGGVLVPCLVCPPCLSPNPNSTHVCPTLQDSAICCPSEAFRELNGVNMMVVASGARTFRFQS